jgi:ASPIC and UnbV
LKAEKIVIHWPSGLVETLSNLAANRYYLVREGHGVDSTKTKSASSMRIAR